MVIVNQGPVPESEGSTSAVAIYYNLQDKPILMWIKSVKVQEEDKTPCAECERHLLLFVVCDESRV